MVDDATHVDISRLKRRQDFLRVAAERRKWVTPGLILQAAPMPRSLQTEFRTANAPKATAEQLSTPDSLTASPVVAGQEAISAQDTVPAPPMARVGFTVSKKVGNSVQRNRARRRLRAVVDALMAELASAGTDYVVIGRVQTLDRPYEDLLKDFRTAMKRVLTASKSAPYPSKGGKGSGFGRGKGRGTPQKQTAPAPSSPPPQGTDAP